MENVTNVLQTFSTWAISITAIVAALSAVCKPVRDLVQWGLKRFSNNSEIINEIKSVKTEMNDRMDAMNGRMDDMRQRIEAVSTKNDENERDRLKHTIYQYGNYARKGQRISSEEFRYLQECFEKYTGLGGNGSAHKEMDFVTDYYNHQHWD